VSLGFPSLILLSLTSVADENTGQSIGVVSAVFV
jgi:hypothetical protein